MSTTLVVGATGTTGTEVTRLLRAAGADALAASRRAQGPGAVRFDWTDPATFRAALDGVERAYLVAPVDVLDPVPIVRPFLDQAVRGGLRRAVLLSSSAVSPAETGYGGLQRLVTEQVPEGIVLRPSWFMQNFVSAHPIAQGLRDGRVETATGDGRVAFVDARDIAAVAAHLLLADHAETADLIVTGPEALGYAEVCTLVSRLTGRDVRHVAVPPSALAARISADGVPRDYAEFLAGLDVGIAHGSEDRVSDVVARVLGRPPRSVPAFLIEHQALLRAGRPGGR